MKILSCEVKNFASYKELDFIFDGQGLTLVSGPTGSGKSTLCDIVPWVLFGRTAKGGSVDEVISWGSSEATEGQITVQLSNGTTQTITRIRTKKSQDLYYDNGSASKHRGKDVTDTQKQINNILGLDYDLYMSAAYFHEFSTTAQFFTTTAKIRRQITEQLVDLSLAKKLVDRASDYRKEVKAELAKFQNELNVSEGVLKNVERALQSDTQSKNDWEVNHAQRVADMQLKVEDYKNHHAKQVTKALKEFKRKQKELEDELLDIEGSLLPEADLAFYRAALNEDRKTFETTKTSKCPACGNPVNKDKEILLLRREHELKMKEQANADKKRLLALKVKELQRHNDTEAGIKAVDENPYVQQLAALTNEENPFKKMLAKRATEKTVLFNQVKSLKADVAEFTRELSDIELLLDVTDTFRSLLVKNTVSDLETNTNKILHDYFDSEIQVKFELSDADKLEATITKDGNVATFTQLSKGQRQLLKLSFGVSIMKCVSNHHGIDFNAIFMDEALDGLDDVLKVKAFDLLQQLSTEHDSVFVVEHNEALKALFPNRFEVTFTNEGSMLEHG